MKKKVAVKPKIVKPQSAEEFENSPMYREAVLLKILRAMKNYGFQEWMRRDLKNLGISI
jgi:hypothetical protein